MNHKRKKPRTINRGPKHYPIGSRKGEAPSYWNIIFHVGSADPDEGVPWKNGDNFWREKCPKK